ncbi:MAG: energy-coupling factor transporter transmembrane protein EcfT [Synergistaceae bacterium]|jgi:energy-coupling factor transport system permease protein|nr:energy-coupling factor transporter transmembrane protein EcfT [Synergistaceae bacterium]
MQFLSGISLGQFIPGESLLHRLDPRCKITATFILLSGLFMASKIPDFAFWGIFLLSLSAMSGIPLGIILRSARPVLFLVAFTAALNAFWTPGREVFRAGFLSVTIEGLVMAFEMGMRLVFLVMFASMLMMTTSPMAFSDGLERLLSPLAKVGFPASEMAVMMTIALRFIPTLFEETDRILKAQISRGADFESGGLLKRARSFIPVLIPLFILVFQRAENLAVAMESRCYVPGMPRTRLNPLVWTKNDTGAILGLLAFISAVILFDRFALKSFIIL